MKRSAPSVASFSSIESLQSMNSTDTNPHQPQHCRCTKRRRTTTTSNNNHNGKAMSARVTHATLLKQLILLRVPLTTDSILFKTQPAENDISPAHLERYTSNVVNAIRTNDVDTLETLLAANGPECFRACNRNGESLLHLACRRSEWPVIDFLLHKARVPITVRDLSGRGILHDVMWRPRPAPEIVQQLVMANDSATSSSSDEKQQQQQQSCLHPHFLLLPDARGHTPLDYCRGNDVALWYSVLDMLLDKQQ